MSGRRRGPSADQRERKRRAENIRRAIANARPVSDIDRAWLAKHEEAVRTGAYRKRVAPTKVTAIIAVAALRYGVPARTLVGRRRAGMMAELARAGIVTALRRLRLSYSQIGAALGRSAEGVFNICGRGRQAATRRRFLDAEAAILIAAAARTPATGGITGERVTMTVTVEVGSPLWNALDRLAEIHERNAAALERGLGRFGLAVE